VALLHGNTMKARQYLEPWARHQYAWCNLGLLCLMEGNRAQAEVYLRMAASNGVPQARDALRSLQLR
jgi:TPR repeat protein